MSSLTKSPDARVEMAESSVKSARFGRQKDSRRTAAGNSSWKNLMKVNFATIFLSIFFVDLSLKLCTGYLYSSPQWSFLAVSQKQMSLFIITKLFSKLKKPSLVYNKKDCKIIQLY